MTRRGWRRERRGAPGAGDGEKRFGFSHVAMEDGLGRSPGDRLTFLALALAVIAVFHDRKNCGLAAGEASSPSILAFITHLLSGISLLLDAGFPLLGAQGVPHAVGSGCGPRGRCCIAGSDGDAHPVSLRGSADQAKARNASVTQDSLRLSAADGSPY